MELVSEEVNGIVVDVDVVVDDVDVVVAVVVVVGVLVEEKLKESLWEPKIIFLKNISIGIHSLEIVSVLTLKPKPCLALIVYEQFTRITVSSDNHKTTK